MRYSYSLLVVSFFFAIRCPQSDSWKSGSREPSSPSYGYSLIRANLDSSPLTPTAYSSSGGLATFSPRLLLNSHANCQKFLGACSFFSPSSVSPFSVPVIRFSRDVDCCERSSSEKSEESDIAPVLRMNFCMSEGLLCGTVLCHWRGRCVLGHQLFHR